MLRPPITVAYRSCDGCRIVRKFKTLRGARKFAQYYVGEHPDIGSGYAVSFDGIGTIRAEGCSLQALFPRDRADDA
jgi:hypothetical protein